MANRKQKSKKGWDFPGDPVVMTLPSNAVGTGLIPGWGAKILHFQQPKSKIKNRNNIVTSSIKTLKMVHIKKTFNKKGDLLRQEKGRQTEDPDERLHFEYILKPEVLAEHPDGSVSHQVEKLKCCPGGKGRSWVGVIHIKMIAEITGESLQRSERNITGFKSKFSFLPHFAH